MLLLQLNVLPKSSIALVCVACSVEVFSVKSDPFCMIYNALIDYGGPTDFLLCPNFMVPSSGLLFDAFSQMVVFYGVVQFWMPFLVPYC